MAFDLGRWATKSLKQLESTLDRALQLEPQQPEEKTKAKSDPSPPDSKTPAPEPPEGTVPAPPDPDQPEDPGYAPTAISSAPEVPVPASQVADPEVKASSDPEVKASSDPEVKASSDPATDSPEDASHSLGDLALNVSDQERLLQKRVDQIMKQKERIAQLEKDKMELASIVHTLKDKVSSLNKKLKGEVAVKDEKIAELLAEVLKLRKQSDNLVSLEILVKAKDDQVAAVLAEGEELSKKQAKMETQARTLRQSIRDLEKNLESCNDALKAEQARSAELGMKLANLTDKSSSNEELLKRSTELERKSESLTIELQNALSELEASRKIEKELKSDILEQKEELDQALSRLSSLGTLQRDASGKVDSLQVEIDRLSELCENLKSRHDMEMEDVRTRLEESEKRNQELCAAVPEATRPLLRQIETLRTTLKTKADSWVQLEDGLRSTILSLHSQIEPMRIRVAALEEELRVTREGREEKEAELISQSKSLQEELTAEREGKLSLQQSEAVWEAKYVALSNDFSIFRSENTSKLTSLEAALSSFKSRVTELETLNFQLLKDADVLRKRVHDETRRKDNDASPVSKVATDIKDPVSSSHVFITESLSSLLRQKEGDVVSLRLQLIDVSKQKGMPSLCDIVSLMKIHPWMRLSGCAK